MALSFPFWLTVDSSSKGVMWVTKWKVTVEDDSTRWTEQSLATVKLACINPGLPTWTFILKASLLFKALRHWIICPLKQFVAQRHHTSLPNCLFCGHGACACDTLCLKTELTPSASCLLSVFKTELESYYLSYVFFDTPDEVKYSCYFFIMLSLE